MASSIDRREYHRRYQRHRRTRSYEEFLERNPEEFLFAVRTEQRKRLLQATPDWVNRSEINAIYRHCVEMNRAGRMKYRVIHEVPVLGHSKKVCGLHVPWNLRIVRDI